jgi:hypothetical protein
LASIVYSFTQCQQLGWRNLSANKGGLSMANKEQNRKGKSNKPKLTPKEKQAKKLAAKSK